MALKTPVRVKRQTFASGTTKTITFDESTPLDSTHLILAFIYVNHATTVATPSGWTQIFGGGTGSGPTQIRCVAIQGDDTVNGITFTTPSAAGSITLVAYPDFVSLSPITAAASANVTTATTNYAIPDIGSGTANGIVFDMIGGPSTFVGATYNRGTLIDALDASGQMILAQEYTDGSADQSVTVTMPTSRVGRYSAVVMPIGVGSGGGTAGTITGVADTSSPADGGSASLLGSANGTISATAGLARAGVDEGFPETWPDEFGPLPAYLTGAGTMTGAADASSTAAGGSTTLIGQIVGLMYGAADMSSPAAGGTASMFGGAASTMNVIASDAPATGYDATLIGAAPTTMSVTADTPSPASGGQAELIGGAASTMTALADTPSPAAGGNATLIGAVPAVMMVTASDASATGYPATLRAVVPQRIRGAVVYTDRPVSRTDTSLPTTH